MNKNPQALSWILLIILSLIWGSSFILIKKGLQVFSAVEVGALRIAAASVFLAPIAIGRFYRIKRQHLLLLLEVGFVGSLGPAFFFAIAQTQIPSSLTGVLNALTPMFVALVGVLFFKQHFQKNKILGLAIGFLGTVILILSGSAGQFSHINYYALFVVLATICYGFNLNIIKTYLADLKSLTITSVSLLFVAPASLILLFFFTDFTTKMQTVEGAWLAFGYIATLGVVGTAIALILFNHLVKITTPVFTSSVTYLIPIVAVIWGLLDNESLYTAHYAGMAAILLGVYLINRR